MKKVIHTTKAPEPIGPYNQAIMIGDTLYVSGQIPINPETKEIAKGDVKMHTEQVMKNLQAILHEAGMDFTNVVKCSIFVSDMKHFPLVNEVYGSYFKDMQPARETVQVSGLPMDVDVEISCIAVV